ncbi:uncharacterized protein PAC_02212 [Phialocephala subalpina]|uniref:Major facilitator superfamily (MFS) profile domain-containing protein n=1 Tax=Phialocephala subalpina TaxID=576137 RepID=A0A1L7WHT5_9HELO|nr:uncharacterized protein PAC_02212 [Phialocephala subalpina]
MTMIQPKELAFRLFTTVACFALAGQAKGWDEGAMTTVTSLKSFQATFGITPISDPNTDSNLVSPANLTAGVGANYAFVSTQPPPCVSQLNNLGALYFGRLVAGVGFGTVSVVGPMVIVEIAPMATRGLMTLWFNVCMLGGQMIGTFVCYGCTLHIDPESNLQWQIPFFVQTFVPAIALFGSFFIYESSRWLCIIGQNEEKGEERRLETVV